MCPAIKKVGTSKTGSALAPKAEFLPCKAAPCTRSELLEDLKLHGMVGKGWKQLKPGSAGDFSRKQGRKTMSSYGFVHTNCTLQPGLYHSQPP